MKFIKLMIILSAFVFVNRANAGTCTSITRSNAAANSILTSTQYNNDLNTVYNFTNAYDGGCISSGTVESDSLNTTQFAVVLNGIKEGCTLTNTDSNTISVDRCMISVNGNFVRTVVATTVTWGCTSCSSEASSTEYYVYAKAASTGATLSLLISTTAPNGDGYDASSNKALGRFFNDGSSNIMAVENWVSGRFGTPRSLVRVHTADTYPGTVETKIPRFTTIVKNVGPDITYSAGSSSQGARFTVNSDGIYAITFCWSSATSAGLTMAITLNDTDLTSAVSSVTAANRLAYSFSPAVSGDGSAPCPSWTGPLSSGDIIRPHTGGEVPGTAANGTVFSIAKVSP